MRQLRLADGLDKLIDHRGKTPLKLGSAFTNVGVPVVSAIMVKDGRIDFSHCRHVSAELASKWMEVPTQRGDVLMTSEAPLGRLARVATNDPLVLGQRIFALRGRPGVLDSDFLYFALQNSSVQAQLIGLGTGTTVTGIRQSALRDLKITVPKFDDQRAIAAVLGALDEKIGANTALIRTARELAGMMFDAIRPENRSLRLLGDVLSLKYGKALPAVSRRAGSVSVVGSGGLVGSHEEALVDGPCVVVGRKGSVGSTYWIPGPTFPIDTTFYVEPSVGTSLIYCYVLLRSLDLAGMNSDSAVPGLNRAEALALRVLVPDEGSMAVASLRAEQLFATADQHDAENLTLAELRDTLLPALMSGQLRVKDVERQVEDAV